MKNLLLILPALLVVTSLVAQNNLTTTDFPLKGKKFINGQVGFGYDQSLSNFNVTVAPGFGYFIRDNKVIGARVGFYYNSSLSFINQPNVSFNPYGRKYYNATLLGVKAALFAEAGFNISSFQGTPWNFYLLPGFAIFPHKHWAFELNLPNVFSLGAINGDVNFQTGLNLGRGTGIAVVYFLGKK